jgi:hypothetical protein
MRFNRISLADRDLIGQELHLLVMPSRNTDPYGLIRITAVRLTLCLRFTVNAADQLP